MKKFKDLNRKTKEAIVMVASIVAMVIMSLLFMFASFGNLAVAKFIDGGPFDTQFFYSGDAVYNALQSIPLDSLVANVKTSLVYHIVDYLYIITYFLSFVTIGLFFLGDNKPKLRKLVYTLPIVVVFFDICENVFLDALMMTYVNNDFLVITGLGTAAGVFTLLKNIFIMLETILLLYIIGTFIVNMTKKAKSANVAATTAEGISTAEETVQAQEEASISADEAGAESAEDDETGTENN